MEREEVEEERSGVRRFKYLMREGRSRLHLKLLNTTAYLPCCLPACLPYGTCLAILSLWRLSLSNLPCEQSCRRHQRDGGAAVRNEQGGAGVRTALSQTMQSGQPCHWMGLVARTCLFCTKHCFQMRFPLACDL